MKKIVNQNKKLIKNSTLFHQETPCTLPTLRNICEKFHIFYFIISTFTAFSLTDRSTQILAIQTASFYGSDFPSFSAPRYSCAVRMHGLGYVLAHVMPTAGGLVHYAITLMLFCCVNSFLLF